MKTTDLDTQLGLDDADSKAGAARCDAPFDDVLRALSRAPSVRPEAMDLVGRRVGRFVVERRLGQGGMGIVYEAHDPVLARKVALKVLRAGHLGQGGTRARLHEEARRVAALHHPHIAAVYDVGEHDGIVFLAMERAGDRSLRVRLATPPAFTFAQTTSLLRAIASGLACAHDAGIVHRDLKPENVVTGDDGTVKIIDFGIATSGSDPARCSLRAAGTRRYMAPEQAEGAPPTPRADVFAFGVLAREVLSATAIAPRDRGARAALLRLLGACTSEAPAPRPRDGAALVAALDAIAPAARGAFRPGAVTVGAAAIAAVLGVVVARSVPQREGPATASAQAHRAEAAASPDARSAADRAGDPAATHERSAPLSRRDTPEDEGGAKPGSAAPPIAPRAGGDPLLAQGSGQADLLAPPTYANDGTSAMPVTTAMDRRGRLFATVPLDGVAGTRPAPAGTLVPLGTLTGSTTTRAEVVPDGHGGTVIHLTLRVTPPAAAGSQGGAHTLTPGTFLTTDVSTSTGATPDPLHLSIDHPGKTGNPAHPTQPENDTGNLCTAAPPNAVHTQVQDNGTMRVFAHDDDGDEITIALVGPDGEIAAFGEGASPCDREDTATHG